jgi:hypothetical protein
MYNQSFERAQRILARVERHPEILGYFPKSTMSGDFNQAPSGLSDRKYLEEDIILSFFHGNMESIELYADNIDLMVFERYENYLDGEFDSLDIQRIINKGSHFFLSAKPLEGFIKGVIYNNYQGEKLDKALDCLMAMGGHLYSKDQRYLAYAVYRVCESHLMPDRSRQECFSQVIGKLAERGLIIDPEHFKVNSNTRKMIQDMFEFQYWNNISSIKLMRYLYLSSILSYQVKNEITIIDADRISGLQALEQLAMAYTFNTSDKLLFELNGVLPFEKMVSELNRTEIKCPNPSKYVLATSRTSEYNGAALLSKLISQGNGNMSEVREHLIREILNAGMASALQEKNMQLSMIQHMTARGLAGETWFFNLVAPHLDHYDALGIKDQTLFELCYEGNAYARREITRLEKDPKANEILLRVGKVAPPYLLKWMIDKQVLGATPHMLRLSEHNQIKREVLTSDLGM